MSDDITPQLAASEQATPSITEPASASEVPTAGEQGSPESTETVEDLRAKLAKYKEIASTQEKRAKANAAKARQFDELTEQSKSELERAQDEAKRLSERVDSYRDRAVRGEAKALAANFANPDVAVRLLGDLRSYVDDNGDIDTDRLSGDLGDLLKREPYLARVTEPAGMRPNPAQGQSGAPALSPSQRIADSERQGDWKTSMRLKADALMAARNTK